VKHGAARRAARTLAVVFCVGGCAEQSLLAPSAPRSTLAPSRTSFHTPPPTIAVRAHVEEVDDNPPEREIFDDASTGFPAISRDGAKVAVLESEEDLSEELSLSLAIFPARGGSAIERIVLVSTTEARADQTHRGSLLPVIEGRARAVNQRLVDEGYAAMPRVNGDIEKATLRIDDVEATLHDGRFRVTDALRRARLDVDAREWQRAPVRSASLTCVTHPAIKWGAYDRARGVLVVEITHAIEEGGDSCPTPSLFKVFSLDVAP
jgi:hypothetical protein